MTFYHTLIIFLLTFLNTGYTQEIESFPELAFSFESENVTLSYNSTEIEYLKTQMIKKFGKDFAYFTLIKRF